MERIRVLGVWGIATLMAACTGVWGIDNDSVEGKPESRESPPVVGDSGAASGAGSVDSGSVGDTGAGGSGAGTGGQSYIGPPDGGLDSGVLPTGPCPNMGGEMELISSWLGRYCIDREEMTQAQYLDFTSEPRCWMALPENVITSEAEAPVLTTIDMARCYCWEFDKELCTENGNQWGNACEQGRPAEMADGQPEWVGASVNFTCGLFNPVTDCPVPNMIRTGLDCGDTEELDELTEVLAEVRCCDDPTDGRLDGSE